MTQAPGSLDAAVSPPGDPGTTATPPPPPSLEGDGGNTETHPAPTGPGPSGPTQPAPPPRGNGHQLPRMYPLDEIGLTARILCEQLLHALNDPYDPATATTEEAQPGVTLVDRKLAGLRSDARTMLRDLRELAELANVPHPPTGSAEYRDHPVPPGDRPTPGSAAATPDTAAVCESHSGLGEPAQAGASSGSRSDAVPSGAGTGSNPDPIASGVRAAVPGSPGNVSEGAQQAPRKAHRPNGTATARPPGAPAL